MKNFNKNKTERVEVMALFGYEMTPCQPLTFRRRWGKRNRGNRTSSDASAVRREDGYPYIRRSGWSGKSDTGV